MLSLLIGALQVLNFPGGSPADLAKALSDATKAPVVISADPNEGLSGFSVDVASLDEMARAILKADKLRRAPGADNVFFHPGLPASEFELSAVRTLVTDFGARSAGNGSVDPASLTDGRVTFQTKPRTGISLGALRSLKTSKPLSIDPFFERESLSIWCDKVLERDFLNMAAKAIGATIVVKKDSLSLEPNGPEILRRALATFDEAKRNENFSKLSKQDKADFELSRSAVASISGLEMAALVSSGMPLRFEIGPSMRGQVSAYLQLMSEPSDPGVRFGPPNSPTQSRLPNPNAERFRSIDPRLLGYVTVSRGFRATLELATVGQNGRLGPLMRVP